MQRRAQLLSDPGETTANCNRAKLGSLPFLSPSPPSSSLLLSILLLFHGILLPNNTDYRMKRPFYYATCTHASEIASAECRDRTSYQASRGFAQSIYTRRRKENLNFGSPTVNSRKIILYDNVRQFFHDYQSSLVEKYVEERGIVLVIINLEIILLSRK